MECGKPVENEFQIWNAHFSDPVTILLQPDGDDDDAKSDDDLQLVISDAISLREDMVGGTILNDLPGLKLDSAAATATPPSRALKQVAKVMPISREGEGNEESQDTIEEEAISTLSDGGELDPLAAEEEPATVNDAPSEDPPPQPSTSSGFSIRLKNFAVDPASLAGPSPPQAATPPSSWHFAEGEPQQQLAQPTPPTAAAAAAPDNTTSFIRASVTCDIRLVLTSTNRKNIDGYVLLTSNLNIEYKLFVHSRNLDALPKTDEGWTGIQYTFWPNPTAPTNLQLVFCRHETEPFRSLSVSLPANNDETLGLVNDHDTFALSRRGVANLNRHCITRYGMPFIERGFNVKRNKLQDICLDNEGGVTAEDLFNHLKGGLQQQVRTVDELGGGREKTCRHLRTLLIHYNLDASKAPTIENNMYRQAQVAQTLTVIGGHCIGYSSSRFFSDAERLFPLHHVSPVPVA